jgi:polysaccharide biosynthesis protein PslH
MAASFNQHSGLRCLCLAREIPLPLSAGENVYTARLAQALVAAGASVTFMGPATSATSSLPAAEAFEGRIEWRIVPGRLNPIVLALTSPFPLAAARCATRDYARHLEAMLCEREFDAVILNHYPMVWAVDHIQRKKKV